MNDEEIRSTIEEIRAQVKAKPENKDKSDEEIDEMILDAFFKAYTEGEMSKEDLGGLAQAMGYEFTEEFAQDEAGAPDMVPQEGEEGAGAATPGVTQEDLEDVRTMGEGESEEEFKDKVEDVAEGKGIQAEAEGEAEEEESEEEESEDGEDEEDEERKKASELWKMDLGKK